MIQIATERLLIREHEHTDIDDYHSWISDPDVMRYVAGFPRTDTKQESLASLTEAIKSRNEQLRVKYFVALTLKNTGEYIGSGGGMIKNRHGDTGIMGIGYFLRKQYWGTGYGTEATRAWIDYNFVNLGVHKIEAGCDIDNEASERIMVKCGMKREGCLREHRYREGTWRDGLQYGILKSDWERVNG
ncbi:MAG: GNAT family N-acetyltransferase [Spirochaetales bacterium]|jgi:[ribosomal protein S5]-alanine N-acetyltransferase|nr:GNAT family N-acetyltransferase [Spirochaetales bacterium]